MPVDGESSKVSLQKNERKDSWMQARTWLSSRAWKKLVTMVFKAVRARDEMRRRACAYWRRG